MSKILVLTGATGKKSGGAFAKIIGENLDIVETFFPDGIRAVVRETSNTADLDARIPNIKKYTGPLTDVDTLKRAFENADTVVHIAGIHWSKEVVDAAAFCGVRRIIAVHTCGVYSKYKNAGEKYRQIDAYVCEKCKENNIILTILRPTMIYGNSADKNIIEFIKMVDKYPLMPVVNGANYELQPVHYEDLASAYFNVLTNENITNNKEFILSGKEPITLRAMLSTIGDVLGKKVRFINCPYWLAYSGACIIYCLTAKKKDYREKVQRLCESRAFSHEEASAAFGFNPRAFSDGIINEVNAYRGNN